MKGKIHKEKRKKEYACHPYHHICDDRTKEKGKRMDKKKKNLSHPNNSSTFGQTFSKIGIIIN
jgi:hypothetical protein